MELLTIKCPNCHGTIQVDPTKETGFCSYCGTKLLFSNNSKRSLIFNLSDYFIDEPSIRQKTEQINEIKKDKDKLLKYADDLISNENSYLGWYYKGLCLIDNYSIYDAIESWTKAAVLCSNKSILREIYEDIISILVKIKIKHDSEINIEHYDDYLRYPSFIFLENVLCRSELTGYERYDLYFDLIKEVNKILPEIKIKEHNAVINIIYDICDNFMKTYCDFQPLFNLIKASADIGIKSTISLVQQHGTETKLVSIDSKVLSYKDLDTFLTITRSFHNEDNGYPNRIWGSSVSAVIAICLFSEYFERFREEAGAETVRKLKNAAKERVTYDYIKKYDDLYEIIWWPSNKNPLTDNKEYKKMTELIDSSFELLIAPLDQPKKKRLLGFLKK